MSQKRKSLLTSLVALLVIVGGLAAYYGPQVLKYLELRPNLTHKPAFPRGLDSTPQSLAVSTASTAQGTTLSYFGYRFDVPWKKITAVRNPADWVDVDFEGGQTLKFANPNSLPNPQWDEGTKSNYDGYRSVLAITPAQISPFSSHRNFAHAMYLLDFKGAWFEHNSAAPDVYSFETPSYHGLEVSGLPREWQWAQLYLFDAHDRRFEFIFSVVRGSTTKLAQPEINRVIQSFAPQPERSQ